MLKPALLLAAVLGAIAPVWADGTVEERQTAVKLYRGTRIIAASDPKSDVYVPDFTIERCEVMREASWQHEALTRSDGSATYKCQVETRAIVQFHPAPLPICADRPGPDEQRELACPPGTVGIWLQDRVWALNPYPICWIQSDWMPVVPPESMCAIADSDGDGVPDSADECPTVHATTPNGCPAAPPPPERLPAPSNARAEGISTSRIRVQWDAVPGAAAYSVRRCIGGSCEPLERTPLLCVTSLLTHHGTLPPNLTVSYRIIASRSADCSDGGEPTAIFRATTHGNSPPPPPAGSAALEWTAPSANTDGSALTTLAGTRIHYGTNPEALAQTIQVANPSATSHTVTGLAPGTWYFAVRAYTTGGAESAPSNIASKVVQ